MFITLIESVCALIGWRFSLVLSDYILFNYSGCLARKSILEKVQRVIEILCSWFYISDYVWAIMFSSRGNEGAFNWLTQPVNVLSEANKQDKEWLFQKQSLTFRIKSLHLTTVSSFSIKCFMFSRFHICIFPSGETVVLFLTS